MDVARFLGVPHEQLNSYLRQLVSFRTRAGRAAKTNVGDIPASPDFSLKHDDGRTLNKRLSIASGFYTRSQVLGTSGDYSNMEEKPGSDSDPGGVKTLVRRWEELASSYPSRIMRFSSVLGRSQSRRKRNEEPGLLSQPRTPVSSPPKVQRSSILAREYAADMMAGFVGDTIKEEEEEVGDVNSVKTFGWRMVKSEELINPHRAMAFADFDKTLLKPGETAVVRLVYVPMAARTRVAAFRNISMEGKGIHLKEGSDKARKWSFNAHEAMAYSAWTCPLELTSSDHDVKGCLCRDKAKRIGVCAMLCIAYGGRIECGAESNKGSVLPLRLETYAWSPESAEEIRAYAEFAKGCVENWI